MSRSPADLPIGPRAPRVVTAVIEIPQGSKNKYELDERSGLLRLDRVLASALRYPVNYGFVPSTRGPDGDPLDILVLGQEPIVPLTIVNAKPLAVIRMEEADGTRDFKIVAVHLDDPHFGPYKKPSDLPPHVIPELEQFFLEYKKLERKPVKIKGFEGASAAQSEIERAAAAPRQPRRRHRAVP